MPEPDLNPGFLPEPHPFIHLAVRNKAVAMAVPKFNQGRVCNVSLQVSMAHQPLPNKGNQAQCLVKAWLHV